MDEQSNSDVIVIDDDPGPSSTTLDRSKGNSTLEIQEDLFTLFHKLFPDPVVDLSGGGNDKGTSCGNVRCKSTDEELVVPSLIALSYFNLSSKSLLLCKKCINIANIFSKDMMKKYYVGDSIYDCSFPPTNPVVLIDSDDSDVEEDVIKSTIHGLCEEDSLVVKEVITDLIKKHFLFYNVDEQVEIGRDKVQELMELTEVRYGNLITSTLSSTSKFRKDMENLYDTFSPKRENMEPLEIPFEDLRPSKLPLTQNERRLNPKKVLNYFSRGFKEPTQTPTILINPVYKRPDDLPPSGSPMRPKPMPGQKFYVMNDNPNRPDWVPAIVIQRRDNDNARLLSDKAFGDVFRVKVQKREEGTNNKIIVEREVSESLMAYFTPPSVSLMLGSRVIALSNSYTDNPRIFFAGVVAEPPSVTNKYRYLIFYDDGYVQYVRHKELRLIVRSKPNVSEYFQLSNQRFIKDYFNTYPERPMLKIELMGNIRVMRKGVWANCRVIEIDASLIRVLFLRENYTEWIYRGSSRLRPLFEHGSAIKGDLRPRISRGTANPNGPLIIYDLADSDNDESDYQSSDSSSSRDDQPDKLRRAVAKKSTNRLPDIYPPLPQQPFRRYAKRMTRQQYGKIETLIPSNSIHPMPFKKHICGTDCVASVHYDERKTKSVNPLIVPSLFGFRRDSDMNLIFYHSPCGKKLRSMLDVIKYTSDTKILIGVDHFDFDPSVHIFDEFIVPSQLILLKDLSHGRENVPIPVVNSINAQIPDMMEYMTERRGLEGVHLNLDDTFLVGCDCTDNCQDASKCLCQQMTIMEAVTWSKYFHIEKPEHAGYKYRRLSHGLPSGIWECNNKCKCCRKTCLNRVAQNPLKVKLQLFRTKKKGWGVRCVNDIPGGTFICVYNGNILTEKNANEGGMLFGDEYFAELDYIECMESTKANYEESVNFNEDQLVAESASYRQPQSFNFDGDEEDDDETRLPYTSVRQFFGHDEAVYVMDAKTAGNIGRYFNHSCDPNVHVQSVFVDTHDLRFPWIAFFSQKYVRAGSELTWDYRYEPGKVPGKRLICYCGAANCRKRLL